jgi:AhpD family alkylhydroperoxidase
VSSDQISGHGDGCRYLSAGRANADDVLEDTTMQPRIENPVQTVPGARQAALKLARTVEHTGVPATTLFLLELRASQINGCSVCVDIHVDIHSRELKAAGEPDQRINAVAAWREAPYFTDAERAALALTEAATRLADRPDPVHDEVWDEAARHYDQTQLAGLVLSIAMINTWNRINATTRQISGEWVEQVIRRAPAGQAV